MMAIVSRLAEDFEESWLKKSRRVEALTSPEVMLMSVSMTLRSGTAPSSSPGSLLNRLSRNSSPVPT